VAQRAPQNRRSKAAPEDLQKSLNTYFFFLSREVESGQIRYFQQSIIATPHGHSEVDSKISVIVDEAESMPCMAHCRADRLDYQLFAPEEDPESYFRVRLPIEPTIVAVSQELKLGAASTRTGHVYSPDHEYCPVTGKPLEPRVTSDSFETS